MPEDREPTDPEEVRRFLDTCSGERDVAKYLRGYPDLLSWMFCWTGGHSRFLFCEFPLGSRYKVDVLALLSYSGAWEAHFVELEPVDDRVFTQGGLQSDRLRTAVRQIDDWRHYMKNHPAEVRQDLVRWARERDLLGHFPADPLSNMSGNRLGDMETVVQERFHVVIGRSSRMDPDTLRRFGQFGDGISRPALVSYDRFIQVVANRQASLRRP
jgi:hypothetical protein